MEAKEYLKRIKKLDIEIKNKSLEIEDIENRMRGAKAITYEEKASGVYNIKSPQEKLIAKLIDYQRELEENVNKLTECRKQAMDILSKMDNPYFIDILYKRYFQYKTFEEIAVDMNYSYRNVTRQHGKALQEFDKHLKVVLFCPI